ncbi:UDP-N-acetylmuramate dehydrogenase [Pontibacter akesuensis]|uniref:UDP-N-acetylenolpyruvoylglucosamine reductase n=1 Tax=Pontibacter akesuensis TaxID=388950 RepID=A0A1I7FNR2_9BACT|nr:UDP-N-acetylmuramate dehydrogenase [Pontibacter akesuensis]GHA61263.1 UDP-N-acetylenolpyruvoylglucosamine reductase [Pontibacter akesuensis]SFU37847.1 UDP-N-acetylmuramate dehydrogenase [Pontibacter akesuensis]
MELQKNYPLKSHNTFGMEVTARLFARFASVQELQELLQMPEVKQAEKLVLGGGSNLLLTQDFDGVVLQNGIKGIETVAETEQQVYLKAGGGEVWHEFVQYALQQNLGGVENLSLIPGSVGAAPLQNIGAYGVELKDVFHELEAVHMVTGEVRTFDGAACKFGYRESVFKNELKGQYIVSHVTFRLHREHSLNTSYGAITTTLQEMQVQQPRIQDVSAAVCHIRQSKLPDPKEIGNAGSFFKNPEISTEQFDQLQQEYPAIPSYPISETTVKVPAGWLIEQCGWKGKVIQNYGVHKNQALVLVNYGGASGAHIRQLAYDIIQSVEDKFGIRLHPEVNIL